MTESPCFKPEERPNCATVGLATSTLTTARSVLGSRPTIRAGSRVPSLNTASRVACGIVAAGATT